MVINNYWTHKIIYVMASIVDRGIGTSSSRSDRGDENHIVLNLSFTVAVDKPKKEPSFRETIRDGHRKRIFESLTPSRYFHVSYQLLHRENKKNKTYNTDMVTFGDVVSKVYTDTDTRVVQCWTEQSKEEEGERGGGGEGEGGRGSMAGSGGVRRKTNYFAWRHKHKLNATKPLLLDLHQSVMVVRLWTTVNKVSSRALYDRPRAFRLSAATTDTSGDQDNEHTIGLVRKPSKFPEVSHEMEIRNLRGRNSYQRRSSGVTTEASIHTIHSDESSDTIPQIKINVKNSEPKSNIAELKAKKSEIKRKKSVLKSPRSRSPSVSPRREPRIDAAERMRIDREGLVVLKLNLSQLFSKQGCTSAQMDPELANCGGPRGFEVMVSTPPLPQAMIRELKPMTITVEKLSKLPNTPLSHEELQEKCKPTYVQYKFPTKPIFKTPGLPHAPSLTFNSSNVILLGVIEPSVLVEHLRGPPLVLEVHDRDSTLRPKGTEAVFGKEPQDNLIGTHAFSSDLRHDHMAAKKESQSRNVPYGSVIFDLSILLSDQTTVTASLPVIRGPWMSDRVSNLDVSMGNYRFNKIPPGDYLESGCELSIRIELNLPMGLLNTRGSFVKAKKLRRNTKWKSVQKKTSNLSKTIYPRTSCPFNRLVYIVLSTGGSPLITKLLMKINEINCKTLGLEGLPLNVLEAALSTYKLTREQLSSGQDDLITGFHVEDENRHIIILEGLKEGGIKTLWEEFPHHHSQDVAIKKVFYNSDFCFSTRIYGTLDVDLPKIRLYRPLGEIVKETVIYVHGCVPSASFRALMCLNELELVREMADITRNNLFPTPEEVAALSLQFALPATIESETSESEILRSELDHTPQRPKAPFVISSRSRGVSIPLDTNNPSFNDVIRKRRTASSKDYIQSNISNCEALSELVQSRKPKQLTHFRSQSEDSTLLPVGHHHHHNYSSQTYNSTFYALAKLREGMDENKKYTLSQDYQSATLVPIDIQAEERSQRLHSKKLWKTKEGFVYPGVPSSLQSNTHPMRPDSARVEEISKPFEDNTISTNIGTSGLERDEFTNSSNGGEKLDFDLWKQPLPPCDNLYSASVHLVGETRTRELEERERKDYEEWRKRVIVDDIRFHTYRTNINTELSSKPAAHLDSLQGLLKDSPQKLSLKRDGFRLEKVSPFNVIQCSSLDHTLNVLSVMDPREGGDHSHHQGYQPGPLENHSLKIPGNMIPLRDTRAGLGGEDSNSLHPQSFRLYHQDILSPLSHRPIRPLTATPQTAPQAAPMCVSQPDPSLSSSPPSGANPPHQQLEQTLSA